jgi:undecaprenyl diphosphate synthase
MTDGPNHVGIIMDGNRRWAKLHHVMPWEGHKAGKETLKKLAREWIESDVKYLTLYTFSLKNLKNRNPIEKKYLYDVVKAGVMDVLSDPYFYEQININVIGRWHLLPDKDLKKRIQEMIDKTAKNTKKVLRMAICYDGQDEIVYSCQNLIDKGVKTVTPELIKQNLFTNELPPVDLLIRTGGEKRLSGFLLWDASYAELFFTDKLFPDCVPGTLQEAIEEFKNRKRRFGK